MRTRVGRWSGRVAALAWLGLFVWVRAGDPCGDHGMQNVLTGVLLALAALAGLAVLLFHAPLSVGRRLFVLLALGAAVTLFFLVVRVEGESAEMVPRFAWRSAHLAPAASTPSGRLVLAPPAERDFPGFLGPLRDNSVPGARLARDWRTTPPRTLWRTPIGAGWSAFAVAGGWAFTMEQDEAGQRVSARSVESGALAWSVVVDEPFTHALGGDGPRATPAVAREGSGGRVFACTANGRLLCLDAETGSVQWQHDLVREHGLTPERERELAQYGRASSPLLVGELVIVPAGGEPGSGGAGLAAFERASGARRWAGPPRHFSYSSPSVATLAGVAQVLCVNEDTLSGHALADGRLLWEHPWPGNTSGDASASQAVPLPPEGVFVSKGYGVGGLRLALDSDGAGGLVPRVVWHAPRLLRTKLTNVVIHQGSVYGLDDGTLECVALADGAKRWKEGRYGHGQILLAGGLLLVGSEEGEVLLLEPSPERPNAVLGRFRALAGTSWAHLALSGNVLLWRNAEECGAWELPETPGVASDERR